MTTNASQDPSVLLGVMTSPLNPRLRNQWRQWRQLFRSNGHGFDVRFTLGTSFYTSSTSGARRRRKIEGLAPPSEMLAVEQETHRDLLFLDGREKLPHVGKVTEKSAAWWLNVGHEHPGYKFYCKTDDDTLVHMDRLHAVLRSVEASLGADAAVYFGHIKWRGWDVGHRFQACGGGWGPARKTGDDIAHGGVLPNGQRYKPCPHAAGPYPYMSGGMVCMSRRLVSILSADKAFNDFAAMAKARNSAGIACKSPLVCAAQPTHMHMWHHEDAGVGFNVFRAVVAANATAHIVPVPGHYNDAGIIERTVSAQDRYWSSRSVFVHGIKGPTQYASARSKWNLTRPHAHLGLRCFACTSGGTNGHNGDWQWARLTCPKSISGDECATDGAACPENERMCPVDPKRHFTCCGWPWVVPELGELILSTLRRQPPPHQLPVSRMYGELRKEQRRTSTVKDKRGCVRDCLNLNLPGPNSMSGVLRELALRGILKVGTDAESGQAVAHL